MYILTNGKVVLENEILEGFDVIVEDDRIKDIVEKGTYSEEGNEVIDANGGYITPGFIDIHSDYIENMASPRPTSMIDFKLSLREAEKVLLNCGITTMYHSLSFYGRDLFEVKLIRQGENVRKLMAAIADVHDEKHLIRNRFHARFEIDAVDDVDFIKEYIRNGGINLLSFMDHTPGQGQYRDMEIYRKTMKGYKDISDEELDDMLEENSKKEKVTLDIIKDMANIAKENGISVASHDDDSLEKIQLLKTVGASISEFPINMEVARSAKEEGMLTTAGAPNILLGGSHSGNLSAAEAINAGVIDILCSDYYPAAILHGIFIMHKKYNKKLSDMFKLATINPARAVKIDDEVGSIEKGKKADLLIIEDVDDTPSITTVFVDGNITSRVNFRR